MSANAERVSVIAAASRPDAVGTSEAPSSPTGPTRPPEPLPPPPPTSSPPDFGPIALDDDYTSAGSGDSGISMDSPALLAGIIAAALVVVGVTASMLPDEPNCDVWSIHTIQDQPLNPLYHNTSRQAFEHVVTHVQTLALKSSE